MRRVYLLFAAGLLLKLVGASWDVAWHFKELREALSPPHLVNVLGNLLVFAALAHELRHPAPHRRAPLVVALTGAALFALAIPFDQLWHVQFGIDITTWSPAHLLLFSGTAVGSAGIVLLFLADVRIERASGGPRRATAGQRAMLALLLVLLAESVAFPLTYNEYTTVAVRDATLHPERLDPVIIQMALTVEDPVFHNTPHWLYPVYSVVFAILLATMVRAAMGPGWAAVMLLGLSAVRATANAALVALGWPEAVVPLQYVAIGAAVELAWMIPGHERTRALVGSALGAAAGYVALVRPPPQIPAVPLDASSAPVGIGLAVLAAWLAFATQARATELMARIPVVEWERVPDRMRAWAREKMS